MTTDTEVITMGWSIGGHDPTPPGIMRLNFTFLTNTLDFKILSVRCKANGAILSWMDALWELAGYTQDELEGNWEQLKGSILYLRLRDNNTITGILSRDRKNILKIKPEIRYDR